MYLALVLHPKDSKLPWPLPAHPPSDKAVAIVRRRILILGFIRSRPTLANYGFAHSLPLGGITNNKVEIVKLYNSKRLSL